MPRGIGYHKSEVLLMHPVEPSFLISIKSVDAGGPNRAIRRGRHRTRDTGWQSLGWAKPREPVRIISIYAYVRSGPNKAPDILREISRNGIGQCLTGHNGAQAN